MTEQNTYSVSVNYFLSLEQMIALGKYDRKSPDITSDHFPITKRGTQEVIIELVHFNRAIESDDVLKELDTMGLRPAELPELLAFGTAYPEKQREFPIVALGSVWRHWSGRRGVPCLCGVSGRRGLDLLWFGNRWRSYCRFAALRK